MIVCICLFKIYLQQLFVGRRATGTGHLSTITRPRPLLDSTTRLNRCRRKPCLSENVAISLIIRYYRCRDLES